MAYVIESQAILQATIEGRLENQQVMSVFTYKYTGASPIPDGGGALEVFWDEFKKVGGVLDNWCDCVVDRLDQVRTRLQWIQPDRFAFRTRVEAGLEQGKIAADAMPVNTAIAITKRTQNSGRDQVGTLHMPGVPDTFILNGVLQAVGLAAYQALGDEMIKVINTVGPALSFQPQMFRRAGALGVQPLETYEVSRFARIQRRRTVGLGS